MSLSEVPARAHEPLSGFAFDRRPAAPSSPWWWIAATLVALVLRLWGAADQALWTDEVESLKLVVQPGADPLYVITHNFHGPLHKAMLFVWVSALGLSDWTVRILSVVIGTLTVPLTYAAARRWIGEHAARAAMLLLAINPFHIYYSQEVRGYILLMAFGVLCIWALLADVERRTFRSGLMLFLSSLGACLSSFGGFFIILVGGVLALIAGWRRGYPIRRYVFVHVLVLACLGSYLGEFGTTVEPESIVGIGEDDERMLLRGSHTFSALAPMHSLFAYSVGLSLGPSINEMHRSLSFGTFRPHLPALGAVALLFGVLAIAGVLRAGRRPELRGMLVVWLIVPIAATSLLALLNVKVYNIRYPCVGFVPWLLFVALGLEGIGRQWARVLLWSGVLALSALSIHGLRFDERYWRSDARSAAELILREGRAGDRILNYSVVEPFEYYYSWRGGGGLDVRTLLAWHFRRGRFEPYMNELSSCDGRLWVVRQRGWYMDPHQKAKAAMDAHLVRLGSWQFVDLPVDLYACADSAFTRDATDGVRAGRAGDSTRSAASR